MSRDHADPCEASTSGSFQRDGLDSKLSPDVPIAFQVGHLGCHYEAWLRQPVLGATTPRFFKSDFAEACTKTVWWIVPLLWLPFFSSVLLYSKFYLGVTLADSLSLIMFGIVAWQALGEGGGILRGVDRPLIILL